MAAGKYNMTIEKGSTFSLPIIVQTDSGSAVDLTGYSARGQIRKNYTDADVIVAFAPSGAFDASGSFEMQLSASQTADLPALTAIYDIELFNNNDAYVIRLLEGNVLIKPEVTR